MSKATENRAMRFGMMMAALEMAQHALMAARRSSDMLSDTQRGQMSEASEILVSLQQQLWGER